MQEYLAIKILVVIVLAIFSYIDLKKKEINSIYTTSFLLTIAIIFHTNLTSGIITFIFAWLLIDFRFMEGIADLKLLTALGFMIPFDINFLFFLILFVTLGVLYFLFRIKFSIKKYIRKKKEVAFIPVIFLTYVILFMADRLI